MTKPLRLNLALLGTLLFHSVGNSSGFQLLTNGISPIRSSFSGSSSHNVAFTRSSALCMAVELEPEPEGGKELEASATLPGCRVKEMEELPDIKDNKGTVYKFWMTASVEGALIKEIRSQILKDASKKANFPGFRKGQVPPYAQPQITNFAVQEGIIKTVESAMEAYKLESIAGSNGQLEVLEDVEAMSKQYKTGDSIQFTATLNAVYTTAGAAAAEVEATTE